MDTSRSRSVVTRLGALLAGVLLVAAVGPRVRFEERWTEPDLPEAALDAWLAESEAGVPGVREGDERGIVWADSSRRAPTDVAVVYLHGFSADRHEMEPVVSRLGQELGANVYFARLRGHGRDGPAMGEASVEDWLDDTAEAFAIGRRLGRRVVLVGTSTGGTLATWAATRPETLDALAALVLVSPNFQPRDRSSRILLWPWGGHLARLFVGPERCWEPLNEQQARHWTTCYPTSALPVMMAIVEHVRTADLSTIAVPTLVLYATADEVVDAQETLRAVGAMKGTAPRIVEVRTTTDPSSHVLAGDIVSPGSVDEVLEILGGFLAEVGVTTGSPAGAGVGR